MVFERLVIVNGRFNGHRAAEEKGIAHFHARHHIVVVMVGMHEFAACTEIKTVLNDVIATGHTQGQFVRHAIGSLMFVSDLSEQHQVVHTQIAYMGLCTEIETIVAVVVQVDACQ